MNDLLWARSTMALSLGFHIVFASISMVLPFYMALSHRAYLRSAARGAPSELYRELTLAWSRGAAVLFATGAVSGTVLSFQLGLLWPGFMVHAGPIIGMPFSLEGAAFFLEAIFLGLFLYGWRLLPPRVHHFTGVMVGLCGLASGVLVIAANGWMNSPAGFTWDGSSASNIDPWAAMFNRAFPLQALHMVVAAFQATGMLAAGLHALGLLQGKHPELHRAALGVILPITCAASLFQPLVGDWSAKAVAERQPEKLAAMEAHFETTKRAPLLVGGIPNEETESVSHGLEIPGGLSFLAHGDFDAEVTGLDAFPKNERPPVLVTHFAFQVMVGIGTALAGLALFYFFARWRRPRWLEHRRFLFALLALAPAGFLALEAGWVVTEVGRQPWVIYRVLRTSEAVTPVPGLHVTFGMLAAVYLVLGVSSAAVLLRLYHATSNVGDPVRATHPTGGDDDQEHAT